MAIVSVDGDVLRSENQVPVNGFVVTARKPPHGKDVDRREDG